MTKRYFAPKRKHDTSLTKIIIVISTLLAVGYGVVHFAQWFNDEYIGGKVEANALENLDVARSHFQEGEEMAARDLLRPILARVDDQVITPQALMLGADIELAAQNDEMAIELLARVTNDYRESPDHPIAVAKHARLLEKGDRIEEALVLYETLRTTAPPKMRASALAGLGRQAERERDLIVARDLYDQAVRDAVWGSEVWNEALDDLGRLNATLIFSSSETPGFKNYIIEKGDSLTSIGIKLNTTQGLLTRANGIDAPNRIRLGQRLKYTPKDFRVVIERSTCRIFLLDKDGIFKRYRTGLGMPGHETTLGRYTIGSKQKNPTWYKPGGQPVPPNAPDNELGTRWLPLVPAAEGLPTDLGIHGTIAPKTIGQYMSRGCPRLLNEEVEELYDLVVRSTLVEIIDTLTLDEIESIWKASPETG